MGSKLTIKEILDRTISHFTKYGIQNPRLDAEVLLADLLEMQRIQLYVNFDQPLNTSEIDLFRERVVLRSKRVPVQYIVGHQEFMSLDFFVKKGVLIPRPETEHLVEAVIEFFTAKNLEKNSEQPLIVDVGIGSGAIAISLLHYLSNAQLIGIDISDDVLKIAEENAKKHQVADRLRLIKGEFLCPVVNARLQVHAVVSNPPYIAQAELAELQPEVKYEPKLALDGGIDGLAAYRKIIAQTDVLLPGGLLAFEVGNNQGDSVAQLMQDKFFNITIKPDLAGIDRVVMGQKK